jgi:DNA-binding MarR family transcriptional regulator
MLPSEQDEIWESLRDVYQFISDRLTEVLAPFGLAVTDYRALRYCTDEPRRAIDLTRRLGLTPASGTELIDRLERRKLVKRSKNATDRRSVLVVLTPTGRRLVSSAREARRSYFRGLARSMPPNLKEDLEALRETVQGDRPP